MTKASAASPRTTTLPEGERGAFYMGGPDEVTSLCEYLTGREFVLPREAKTFSLGSTPTCDVSLEEHHLSRLHCTLERRRGALRVRDQGSRNGTYFGGRREEAFEIRPGQTFHCSSLRLLVLDDTMRAAYPVLGEIVGAKDEHGIAGPDVSASDLVVAAAHGANLLITGEPGCDQDRLARTLHEISLRRGRPLVEIDRIPDAREDQRALLDRASRSTLLLTLDRHAPVADATFVSMLLSPSFHIRVIVVAPTDSKVIGVLGETATRQMQHVWVRPLALRPTAILPLLDRILAASDAPIRSSALTEANQAALRSYAWPDNLPGLRLAAERLVAITRAGSLRKAADTLYTSRSSFHYWFQQLGLALPLAPGA